MQFFEIRYRNTQGTLMRILNAASRRGLDLTTIHSTPNGDDFTVTLALDANPKHTGQLIREWYSIMDVIAVPAPSAIQPRGPAWTAPHPPASADLARAQALA